LETLLLFSGYPTYSHNFVCVQFGMESFFKCKTNSIYPKFQRPQDI